ncbi:hypothetical protein E3N88_05801 [Mikania micrantha]|uniref:Uncharacterized protein n=1 Tax=Mikania micrantha TaxID=192012 RepID=A0A5N6PNT5_9ASTR|nr:hypothetical protein E3N88_05801 [Mikania micrantha]
MSLHLGSGEPNLVRTMLMCRETMSVVDKFAKIASNYEIGLSGLNRDPSRPSRAISDLLQLHLDNPRP